MGVVNSVKEWLKHWRCVIRHRPHHFTVQGTLLCRICDAHLLEYIINVTRNKFEQPNDLTDFVAGAASGLAGRE
ncbi:Uncharacterised protein [uncultured archaeon]|nr:Uncharacterised protein [uncultured archaeon]